MGSANDEEMTLVFALSTVERLARPAEVVADARQWSTHIGVASDAPPDDVATVVERAGIDPDVVSGEGGKAGTLAALRQRFPTDRHVFIGTSDEDREIAEALGWEYLSIEDAAEQADWE